MRSIAIIPARGGSKRIPGKNLIEFGGKPAITHVINTAFQSGVFETIIVSTDDDNIADVSRSAGAAIVNRPAELSDDFTPLNPVLLHTLDQLDADFDTMALIYATGVCLKAQTIQDMAAILDGKSDLDYVTLVQRFESAPQRGFYRDGDGCITMINQEHVMTRSQDLRPMYHDAGLCSFGRVSAWRMGKHLFSARTLAYEIDRLSAIDIDEPDDLALAQLIFQHSLEVKSD